MVKRIRLLLDYGCYPVWLYDENNDIIDTLLPEELQSDVELDKKFNDLQARYEALFINNAHEFTYVGFQTEEERTSFWRDWDAVSAKLREKLCGKYPVFDEGVIDHCPVIGQKDLFAIEYTFFDENRTTELSMYVSGKNILGFTNDIHRTTRWNLDELAEYLREFVDTMADDPFPVAVQGRFAAEKDEAAREFDSEDLEEFDRYYDPLDEWVWRHTWLHARAGAILANVFFQQVGDTVEVSWNNDSYEDGVVFDYKRGGAVIPKDTFVDVVNGFLRAYALHWFG